MKKENLLVDAALGALDPAQVFKPEQLGDLNTIPPT
jgi:hypothetical protein